MSLLSACKQHPLWKSLIPHPTYMTRPATLLGSSRPWYFAGLSSFGCRYGRVHHVCIPILEVWVHLQQPTLMSRPLSMTAWWSDGITAQSFVYEGYFTEDNWNRLHVSATASGADAWHLGRASSNIDELPSESLGYLPRFNGSRSMQ